MHIPGSQTRPESWQAWTSLRSLQWQLQSSSLYICKQKLALIRIKLNVYMLRKWEAKESKVGVVKIWDYMYKLHVTVLEVLILI